MGHTEYRVDRRRFLRGSALATLGFIAAACTPSTTQSSSNSPSSTPKKGGEFHGVWPWDAPPKGHFNYFTAGAILSGSIYTDLFIPSLAMYRWAEARWEYLLAESAAPAGDSYEVKLRPGITWSDGASFTARDVATTFWVGRLLQTVGIWSHVDRIDVTGDLGLRFHVIRPSSLLERLVLRTPIRPDSVYGAFAKRTQDLVAAKKSATDDDWKSAVKDVGDLRPTPPFPSVGPYKIDVPSLTAAQLVMDRNAGGMRADTVNFDRVVLYQAENAQVATPLVLGGDVDFANYTFSVTIDKAFTDQGLRVARTPLHTGPAIYFHWEKAPQFQDRRLRQAVAIAINRVESGKIAYGDSGRASKLMAGYSDILVPGWVSPDDQKKLRSYEYDVARADGLLREAGYAKGADGVYAKDGRWLELDLAYPSDFSDWTSAATHAADALNKLGIKITPKGAQSAQQQADLRAGSFAMAIGPWGTSHPHPQQSLIRPLREFNAQASGGGQRYPLRQQTSAGEVDLSDLLDRSVDGYDVAKQKDAIAKLTLAFNELLPCVPLWERYANSPVNDKRRVDGWKPEGDAIYSQGAGDTFAALLLLDGTLHRV